MEIFFGLLFKLIPLYIIIFLGYVAGKYLNVQKESIAALLIYIIAPIVILYGVVNTPISPGTLSIPALFFLIACLISLLTYFLAGFLWKDSTRNLLSFMGGSSNSGYFGLPVALALFGETALGIVALAIVGGSLYNNSFGFFLAAKGKHNTRDSIIKVLKLPILYAFFVGLFINLTGIQLGEIFTSAANNFNGAFTVLGMMLVGVGLGDMKNYEIDIKFISFSLIISFLLWPILMIAIIALDQITIKLYDPNLHRTFMLLSIMPVAANLVSYSTVLKIHPEKTSLAVMVSTVFALIFIPVIAVFFN